MTDLAKVPGTLASVSAVPVAHVIGALPRLRSGLSKEPDSNEKWIDVLRSSRDRRWLASARSTAGTDVSDLILKTIEELSAPKKGRGGEHVFGTPKIDAESEWFLDDKMDVYCNHSTRGHMSSDLHRYLFAACYASVHKRSPDLKDFPRDLLPDHNNVEDALSGGNFADRFRVQCAGRPSTTITSHIAKDGHYYIHFDPSQCRRLRVRGKPVRIQKKNESRLLLGHHRSVSRQAA